MLIEKAIYGCSFFLKDYANLMHMKFNVRLEKYTSNFHISDKIWLCHPLKKQVAVEIAFAVVNGGEEVFTFAEQQELLKLQKRIKISVNLVTKETQKNFKKEYYLNVNEEKSYVVLINQKTYPEFVLVYDLDIEIQEEMEKWCRKVLGDNPKLIDNLFEKVHGV